VSEQWHGKLLQVRCRSSRTRLSRQEAEAPEQETADGAAVAPGSRRSPKTWFPAYPCRYAWRGEVPEACYRSSLCAQGTPVGDADEQLSAQMLRRGGRGRVGSRTSGTGAPSPHYSRAIPHLSVRPCRGNEPGQGGWALGVGCGG